MRFREHRNINALEALFLVEKVQPWIATDYDRVGKNSKTFMTDSGPMSALLSWSMDDVRLDSDRAGKLVETFVFNELSALVDYNRAQYSLLQYRDHLKREIDFIIQRDDGALLCTEIKSGATVTADDFKHIRWFQQNLAKERPCLGVVLYAGSHILPYQVGNWAIPINALWQS